MLDWLFFGFIYSFTVWWLLRLSPPKTVIIGSPDAENRKMFWIAKPEKTWWDNFKEGLPFLLWGVMIGGGLVFLMVYI